jgi:hypothetical protein
MCVREKKITLCKLSNEQIIIFSNVQVLYLNIFSKQQMPHKRVNLFSDRELNEEEEVNFTRFI